MVMNLAMVKFSLAVRSTGDAAERYAGADVAVRTSLVWAPPSLGLCFILRPNVLWHLQSIRAQKREGGANPKGTNLGSSGLEGGKVPEAHPQSSCRLLWKEEMVWERGSALTVSVLCLVWCETGTILREWGNLSWSPAVPKTLTSSATSRFELHQCFLTFLELGNYFNNKRNWAPDPCHVIIDSCSDWKFRSTFRDLHILFMETLHMERICLQASH